MFISRILSQYSPLVLAFSLVAMVASPGFAQEPSDKVIAKINGVEITERELALAEIDLLEQFRETPSDQRRAAVLNALLDIKMLALDAEAAGLDKDPGFQARMAFDRARALHNEFFQKQALNAITDEELKARYDVEIKNIPTQKEVRARHILVETEEAAKEIIAALEGGADFAELAKEKSTGPSGPNGGDLGYFVTGQMVPEFEKAAFELETGKFTPAAVKTQFGWHVIFKEDERDRAPPAFDDVREQIRQIVAREKYFALTQAARSNYTLEVLDDDLKGKLDKLRNQ